MNGEGYFSALTKAFFSLSRNTFCFALITATFVSTLYLLYSKTTMLKSIIAKNSSGKIFSFIRDLLPYEEFITKYILYIIPFLYTYALLDLITGIILASFMYQIKASLLLCVSVGAIFVLYSNLQELNYKAITAILVIIYLLVYYEIHSEIFVIETVTSNITEDLR